MNGCAFLPDDTTGRKPPFPYDQPTGHYPLAVMRYLPPGIASQCQKDSYPDCRVPLTQIDALCFKFLP